MFRTSLTLLALASIPALAQFNPSNNNVTALQGTWSSGSQHVLTGSGFVNPANLSFSYPATTGMSYSFTGDMYYEIARYRMTGNGSAPQCITGVMNWAHGTYAYNSNGSITMKPFGDGFQQIQSPCSATSNFLENYNDTELYQEWIIYQDPVLGYILQMYQFDGTPLSPMGLVSTTANMLPTQPLRNVSSSSSKVSKRSIKRSTNDSPPIGRWSTATIIAVGGLLGSTLLVFA